MKDGLFVLNERMMEVFARNIVASLPRKKRRVYQFIESIEDKLAEKSETKEQFLSLLKEQSPHHQAARHFNTTIDEILILMHEIEDEINRRLEMKINNYKWIDFTEKLNKINGQIDHDKQYFLVIS